jgi:hypothetical protein
VDEPRNRVLDDADPRGDRTVADDDGLGAEADRAFAAEVGDPDVCAGDQERPVAETCSWFMAGEPMNPATKRLAGEW